MRRELLISKLEKEANLAKLGFLRSQMNPHFYFNTLNSINSFVLKNDILSANKFLSTFANLMRDILENSHKEFISVAGEMEVLSKYLLLQQLRFPGLFYFELEAGEQVKSMKIPPMLLQPLVENSVEYAFHGMGAEGFVRVKFEMKNGEIACIVSDNGIGFERSQEIKRRRNRQSSAIRNIQERIAILNRTYKTHIRLTITTTNPENKEFPGTTNQLLIPDFDTIIK
jgi:two-component system, sensor histidine kinase YesM